MKKFLENNKKEIITIALSIVVWRVVLEVIRMLSIEIIPQRTGYIGPVEWVNFDGMHYLNIAQYGYVQFQHAFFPLFPSLISLFSNVTDNYLTSALLIVYSSFIGCIAAFYLLLREDYKKISAIIGVIVLLFFPTSFFLISIYTESLFLLLVFLSFLFARKKRWVISGIFGSLATATRFTAIFLLPALIVEFYIQNKKWNTRKFFQKASATLLVPLGTLAYMVYQHIAVKDALAFIHAQPAFGANRTGGEIILLPQVIWRYVKILATIPQSNPDFWVALLEIGMFLLVILLLYVAWQKKVRSSYIVFSVLSIILPTLTGTFSSIPRYALVSFAIFPAIALIQNVILRSFIIGTFLVLQLLLAAFFFRGYFIS